MADATYEENYADRDNLKQSVSGFLRGDKKNFYIGITSGFNKDDGRAAMRRRFTNGRYDEVYGINRMVAIAKSISQQVCRDIETELLEYYKDRKECCNIAAGGAGRPTERPWSFVYLGLTD